MQGLLELMGIPYTHSGVLASALAMHKERAKHVMQRGRHSRRRRQGGAPRRRRPRRTCCRGPTCSSPSRKAPASASTSCARTTRIRPRSCNDPGWAFGDWLLAERYIPGRELTCAVMGERVLGVTEIVPAETLRFYNYEAKYVEGGSVHLLAGPAFIECLRIGAEVNVDGS